MSRKTCKNWLIDEKIVKVNNPNKWLFPIMILHFLRWEFRHFIPVYNNKLSKSFSFSQHSKWFELCCLTFFFFIGSEKCNLYNLFQRMTIFEFKEQSKIDKKYKIIFKILEIIIFEKMLFGTFFYVKHCTSWMEIFFFLQPDTICIAIMM